jgi:thiaminase
VSVADLPQRHAVAWAGATRHPFLGAVRDATMPLAVFDTWLAQDHRFVVDLLRFQARLLARAPRVAQPVLAAGAVALAALWTLERTYLDAWSYAAPGGPAYREFVEHWTAPEFATYVSGLAVAVDRVLAGESDVDSYFVEVIEAEVGFWEMAWERAA